MTTGAPPPLKPARPRRSRVLRFLPLGIAAWLVLEIWLLTVVAGASSGLTVFLLLVGGLVLGSFVIKRAGRRAFKNLSEGLRQQQQGLAPAPDQGGGSALTMLGGLLIILPGLISDVLGLLLLVPPLQKVLSRSAERAFERKLTAAAAAAPGGLGDAFQQARMHRPDGKVVQGEVIREDQPPTRPSGRPGDPQLPRS
ncbi:MULTISPECIES: FxsA family membrane protein [unclassified Streptomyces]|uniref:FxsA family membrane protein n=1 Tax=unclassified Streptomyces TaxID=2593676 RepID=UPI001110B928|nr:MULTISPECIES: FxsA family membrane protein [unclassified Streptomyces]QCX75184.1 phage T7 F exclusion suppressor FxsA [Streptomyces sp. YIM 121038]